MLTVMNRKLKQKEERMWQLFCSMDTNGDGHISLQEIGRLRKRCA